MQFYVKLKNLPVTKNSNQIFVKFLNILIFLKTVIFKFQKTSKNLIYIKPHQITPLKNTTKYTLNLNNFNIF